MVMKRILCIEDHPEMIELIRLILGRRGFEVEGAVGGREGLELMEQNPPDLVLLDLMMPDVDGWEVYRQIKAKAALKDIPVVIVTAKAQGIDRVLGLHLAQWQPSQEDIPDRVMALVEQRQRARAEKRWAEADALRDQIAAVGYVIEDTPQGPRIRVLRSKAR